MATGLGFDALSMLFPFGIWAEGHNWVRSRNHGIMKKRFKESVILVLGLSHAHAWDLFR